MRMAQRELTGDMPLGWQMRQQMWNYSAVTRMHTAFVYLGFVLKQTGIPYNFNYTIVSCISDKQR